MAGEFRPSHDVLRELKTARAAEGVRLLFRGYRGQSFLHDPPAKWRNGEIDDVLYSRQRNDEAVQLLSTVTAARARFQPIAVSGANSRGALSQASLQWLLGDFEKMPSAATAETPTVTQADATDVTSASAAGISDAQRSAVAKVALNYVGPIASLLCDESIYPR